MLLERFIWKTSCVYCLWGANKPLPSGAIASCAVLGDEEHGEVLEVTCARCGGTWRCLPNCAPYPADVLDMTATEAEAEPASESTILRWNPQPATLEDAHRDCAALDEVKPA